MAFSDFFAFAGSALASSPGKLPPGYSFFARLGRHYDPNQPRVPAGHSDGGQWTRVGQHGGDLVFRTPIDRKLGTRYAANDYVVSDAPSEWKLGAQYAANDRGWDDLDRSHSGKGPNLRHDRGVDAAMRDFAEREYAVIQEKNVRVYVPGFAAPRVYDFVAQDPISGLWIGVEVKTTLYDRIRLNGAQVDKDVAVIKSGGNAPLFGQTINGIAYVTYCWGCELVPDLESIDLVSKLRSRDIPFFHRGLPPRIPQ